MATNPKDGKLLYHLTSLANLESIIKNGLLPREKINFEFENVADEDILSDGKKFQLGEFTPFHFFCPTPFSGAAQKANSDTEFIYLAITRDLAKENNFKVVPKHPLNFDREPLAWEDGMNEIDWDLIAKRDYTNHSCKEACMAESLFRGKVLFEHFNCIFVRTDTIKSKVLAILKENNSSMKVNVNEYFFIRK